MGLAVFGGGYGERGGEGKGDGERDRAQFEACDGGEDQADGRANEQGLLAPPRMGAEGAGDVQRDEGTHKERGDEGREQVAHGVVPRNGGLPRMGGRRGGFKRCYSGMAGV